MLTVQKLCFSYNKSNPVIKNFDMELKFGERLAVMGASGCGKSTLLGVISGFLTPDSGTVVCNAKKISYVFQEPRLFPWLTVEENLKAVLGKNESTEKIKEILELVEMNGTENLYPDELSGGMKSRISLARALVYGGDLFLLDEPFAALDRDLRGSLTKKLRTRLEETGASAIMVTHQIEDAEVFANRILELSPVK